MARKNRRRGGKGSSSSIPKPDVSAHVSELQKPSEHPRPRVCYIDSIPDDVLFQILVELGLPESMTPKMSTILTSICTRWRLLVLNSPLLWTAITNPFDVQARYPELLNPFERSYPALINIVWDFSQSRPTSHGIADICQQMALHSERFQRLTLTNVRTQTASIIFEKWKECRLSSLQTFTLQISQIYATHFFDSNRSPLKPFPMPWLFTSSTLRTLKLENVDIHHFPQLSISHLDIKCLPPTFQSFQLISTRFPQLETLIFSNTDLDKVAHPSASGNDFHHLKTGNAFSKLRFLAICLQSPITNSSDYALPHLSTFMKNVEYVEIVCTCQLAGQMNQWKKFLNQWAESPELRRMKINFSHPSLWGYMDFVNFLPHQIVLEIDYPPQGSEHALVVNMLNNSELKGIVITLALPLSRWLPHKPLTSSTFAAKIQSMRPTLTCPTTIQLSQKQYPSASSAFYKLGPLLTIVLSTPHILQPRLIGTTSEACFLRSSNKPEVSDNSDHYYLPPWIHRRGNSLVWSEADWPSSMGPSPFDIDSD